MVAGATPKNKPKFTQRVPHTKQNLLDVGRGAFFFKQLSGDFPLNHNKATCKMIPNDNHAFFCGGLTPRIEGNEHLQKLGNMGHQVGMTLSSHQVGFWSRGRRPHTKQQTKLAQLVAWRSSSPCSCSSFRSCARHASSRSSQPAHFKGLQKKKTLQRT